MKIKTYALALSVEQTIVVETKTMAPWFLDVFEKYGTAVKPDYPIVYLLCDSLAKRDYAYNFVKNLGYDAIKVNETATIDSALLTPESQYRQYKQSEKRIRKYERHLRRSGKDGNNE